MYFQKLESSAEAKHAHDVAQRAAAARRLGDNALKARLTRREPAKRNRKMGARLDRRLADYSAMIAKQRSDGWSGYKRPGSNK